MVMMMACNNDDAINDNPDAQKSPIAFQSWNTFLMRSAGDYELEAYHNNFVVYGTKRDSLDEVQKVFNAVTCTFDSLATSATGEWSYSPVRYWDKQAKHYKFVAYTPANAPIAYNFTTEVGEANAQFKSTEPLTLTGTNLMEGAPQRDELNVGFTGSKDLDVMITEDVNTVNAFPRRMADVDLLFRHTLSKLVLSIKTPLDSLKSHIIIKSVTVEDYLSKGTFGLNEANEYVWTANTESDKIDYLYTSPATILKQDTAEYFIESLIFPQALTSTQKVTIKYTIESADGTYSENYTYTTDMSKIFTNTTDYKDNTVYSIEFTINPEKDIITFDAGVYEWEERVTGEPEI